MKNTVDVDEIIWDSLTLLAKDLGYKSRNHLVAEALRTFVLSQPGLLDMAKMIKDSKNHTIEK